MIAKKVAQGRGFRGAFNYLMRGSKHNDTGEAHRVAWMATRNLADPNPEHAPQLMRWTANKSSRVQTPLMHIIISWKTEENPTTNQIETVADEHLADLGLDRHQAILVVHEDKAHRHLHMLVNRVHPHTGKAWSTSRDYARIEKSIGRLAKEHGFLFVPGRHNTPEGKTRQPRRARASEYRMQPRTGKIPRQRFALTDIQRHAAAVGIHFTTANTWAELARHLEGHGLQLEGKGRGLVITDGLREMKLSDLGRAVRLPQLEQQFNEPWKNYQNISTTPSKPTVKAPQRISIGRSIVTDSTTRSRREPIAPAAQTDSAIQEARAFLTNLATHKRTGIPSGNVPQITRKITEQHAMNAGQASAFTAKELADAFHSLGELTHVQHRRILAALENTPTEPEAGAKRIRNALRLPRHKPRDDDRDRD